MTNKGSDLFKKVKKLFKKEEKKFFGTDDVKSVETWLQESDGKLVKKTPLNTEMQTSTEIAEKIEKKQLEKATEKYSRSNKIKDNSEVEKMERFFRNAKTEFSEEEFAKRKLEILKFLKTLKSK